MTSLVITEGWNMKGSRREAERGWGAWRDVVVAWMVAAGLAGTLLLTVPRHDRPGPPASLWSLSPSAGPHAHRTAPDAEDPSGEDACSDRDYANELC